MTEPLDKSHIQKIHEFLDIIRKNGGYGTIEIEVKADKIVFINLAKLRSIMEVVNKT